MFMAAATIAAAGCAHPAHLPVPGSGGDDRRGSFSDPTDIDNTWFPLEPGTQFVFEGQVGGVGGLDHQVIFTVTDVVKVINGVPAVVLWDRDFSEGELIEEELAFFAQDDDENVWNLGEYPEEHEDGMFIGAPNTWIDGVEGARGGILVPGDPELGSWAFLQGSSPDIEFLDVGQVFAFDAATCVPAGCFDDLLVIRESSPLEPDSGFQHKLYARGVGNVRIEPVGGDDPETLSLIEVRRLDEAELAEARQAALQLDARAYDVTDVYDTTPPAS
jgi:hypothetical protein